MRLRSQMSPDSARPSLDPSLRLPRRAEFVPSSAVAGAQKTARADKYKGSKGQQEERKVRKEDIDGGKIENELETRAVFA